MRRQRAGLGIIGLLLCVALGTTGCTTVLVETARRFRENRLADAQFTDTKIGAGLLSGFADKDMNLLLDVNADVWELRVLLTGTVSDAKIRHDVVQLARADKRVKKIYDEIQVVPKEEQARRREARKNQNELPKEGVNRAVNDFWIETKISAQLVSTRDVISVNYRWRAIRNTIYLIGRAQSKDELKTVLAIIHATEGVSQVKSFVEIRPVLVS